MSQQKGLVISNCQVQPLKHYLTLLSEDMLFDGFGVHVIPPGRHAAHIDQIAQKIHDGEFKVVVCVHLSDDYQQLASSRIRSEFRNVPV